jgi:hypothetical protein
MLLEWRANRCLLLYLTVTNRSAQIRACDFVATKSHSQFELALNRMRESLELFGHCQPTAFYTDMPTDRGFLEKYFPSLRENVFPVENMVILRSLSYLPHLNSTFFQKNTAQSINDAVRSILDDVPQDSGTIVVGFDFNFQGKYASVQLAYQNRVYHLQVYTFSA